MRFTYFALPAEVAQGVNILGTLLLALLILRKFIYLSRYLSLGSVDLSANEKNADGFEQTQQLIANEYSVNLKYEYSHSGRPHTGYVNFINPFRGTITLGTPGSGKTYVSLEEFMRQFISRGYAAVIYDYKDPALSQLAYSYLRDYHAASGKKTPRWGYISFKEIVAERCRQSREAYCLAVPEGKDWNEDLLKRTKVAPSHALRAVLSSAAGCTSTAPSAESPSRRRSSKSSPKPEEPA